MLNYIKADLFRFTKSKAMKILIVISTICAVIVVFMSRMIQEGKISVKTGNGVIFLFSDANVISILGAVAAGIFICGDFDNRMIHEAVANGCSRGQVIISKTISFCLAIVFILLPYIILISIGLGTGYKFSMGTMSVGFIDVLTTEAGKSFSQSDILKIIAIMAALTVVYIGMLSVSIPIAIILRKPVIVVAVYYTIIIVSTNLSSLKDSSKVAKAVFNSTPFGSKYSFLTLRSTNEDILKAFLVSLMFTAVMVIITYFGFRKSEIK